MGTFWNYKKIDRYLHNCSYYMKTQKLFWWILRIVVSPERWLMLMPPLSSQQRPSPPAKCAYHFFLQLPQLPQFAWIFIPIWDLQTWPGLLPPLFPSSGPMDIQILPGICLDLLISKTYLEPSTLSMLCCINPWTLGFGIPQKRFLWLKSENCGE